MSFKAESLHEALATLGEVLGARNQHFEIVAIGGGALLLVGSITRATKDLDLVAIVERGDLMHAAPLPVALRRAAEDVAETLGLAPDWLNAGPTDLLRLGLPEGFMARTTRHVFGGLILHLAGWQDQIFFKFYAATDQGPLSKHFQDLKTLKPEPGLLVGAARWARTHDPSDAFRELCTGVLATMGIEAPDDL